MGEEWAANALAKKNAQTAAIPEEWVITPPPADRLNVLGVPRECGLLSEKELEITELRNVDALLEKLASGEWTSVEVTTAFLKRAIIAQQVVNCLTEIFIDKALAWAASLDKQLKETGRPVGPLHGLPISLKDQFCIEGLDCCMGYVAWCNKPSEKNAVLVDVLLSAGAVPFIRTNVPQTLMWPEAYNVVFGRTVNPANRTLTCGGSSGGEGALVAMDGSPLGVGTDIGGSVRIPSGLNGLFGLRPSFNRFPYQGAVNSGYGQEAVPSVLGPITSSVSGLKAFTKAVLSQEPWLYDPLCVRKPWDEEAYRLKEHGEGKKMCFGFMWDDGVVLPTPPVKRALEIAKAALEAAGHEVIEWKGIHHYELGQTVVSIFNADGNDNCADVCEVSGEPLLDTMVPEFPLAEQDERPMTAHDGDGPKGLFGEYVRLSTYELWQLQWRKRAMQKDYLDLWVGTKGETTGRKMDAIIMPMAPHPAPPHGKYSYVGYTMVWNVLDNPAAIFPVTTVDLELDVPVEKHEFRYAEDKKVYELYTSPEVFKDAPVNLQLVGMKLEEEAVIGMVEMVSKIVAEYTK
ncbi:general amidase [Dacryopinax primogenitus]|uniref:amidase n=1 Tax=Dacryopinax primogenitus (strain DJM 731) TaxID=1858805 RepID=M5FP69_DACPD|nr:general amidase [Dacryopinax primogenitus]EJT96853.1 general amidase [Dacryopinax primogenitus]